MYKRQLFIDIDVYFHTADGSSRVHQSNIEFVPGIAWLPTPGSISGRLEQDYYLIPGSSGYLDDRSFLGCLSRRARTFGLNVEFELCEKVVIGHTLLPVGRRGRHVYREVRSNVVRTRTSRIGA